MNVTHIHSNTKETGVSCRMKFHFYKMDNANILVRVMQSCYSILGMKTLQVILSQFVMRLHMSTNLNCGTK